MQQVSVAGAAGLQCSTGSMGIKRDGSADAALFVLPEKATYAGVFTTNQFRSACVESALTRLHGGKKVRAVLITSGNANAGTGLAGRADTEMLAAAVASELQCQADEVIVLHTGVIGVPLRAERLLPFVPNLVATRSADVAAGVAAAQAMMTTDSFAKASVKQLEIGGVTGVVAGVAKGAGMIHPRLATMLSVLVTDFAVHPQALQVALKHAVQTSFNAISVDGDTSPNDSVILLATGAASRDVNPKWLMTEDDPEFGVFCGALREVCEDLAKMIVRDGEGATKFIEIDVRGAQTAADADCIAATIATSPLVKTAFFGEDFNPGRILSAIGRAGVPVNFDTLQMSIGGVLVYAQGLFLQVDPDVSRAAMKPTDITVVIDLGGDGSVDAHFFTCDLTHGYVNINAEYTT